jgi:hypothetical protein
MQQAFAQPLARKKADALVLVRPIDPTGKSLPDFENPLSSPFAKIFLFFRNENQAI